LQFSDLTVRVGDKSFQAHKLVLALSSSKFAELLYPEKKTESTDELKLSEVDPKHFAILLRCVYETKIKLSPDELKDVDALLKLAKKYEIPRVQKGLVDSLTSGLKEDTVLPLLLSLSQLDQSVLQNLLDFAAANAPIVVKKPEFLTLPESQVAGIIGSESLEMTEVDAFKRLVEWGRAECGRRKIDIDQKSLASVLSNLIKHIRFPLMTFTEISANVSPTNIVPPGDLVQIFTCLSIKSKFPTNFPYKSVPRVPTGSSLPPSMDMEAPDAPPM